MIQNQSERKNGRLLLYGLSAEGAKATLLRKIGEDAELPLLFLGEDNLDREIGKLEASHSVKNDTDGNSLLLFDEIDDEIIRNILRRLREEGISIRLKAIVTATNKSWTLRSLLKELEEEHLLMTAWHRLTDIVKRADLLLMEPVVLMDEGGFERDVETTKQYLRSTSAEKFTVEKLNDFFFLLKEHLSRLGY